MSEYNTFDNTKVLGEFRNVDNTTVTPTVSANATFSGNCTVGKSIITKTLTVGLPNSIYGFLSYQTGTDSLLTKYNLNQTNGYTISISSSYNGYAIFYEGILNLTTSYSSSAAAPANTNASTVTGYVSINLFEANIASTSNRFIRILNNISGTTISTSIAINLYCTNSKFSNYTLRNDLFYNNIVIPRFNVVTLYADIETNTWVVLEFVTNYTTITLNATTTLPTLLANRNTILDNLQTMHLSLSSGNVTINNGNISATNTISSGRMTITDPTGDNATATTGSLVIQHTAGYYSSIVFPSRINYNSDYGYIQYQDNSTGSGTGEDSRLTIGVHNDSLGVFQDDIYISASNKLYITSDTISQYLIKASIFEQTSFGGGYLVATTSANGLYINNLRDGIGFLEGSSYPAPSSTTGINIWRINYSIYSDIRLKENIREPLNNDVISDIKKIRFVSFDWKKNKKTIPLGIIAQELEQIHIEFVNTGSDTDTFGDNIGTKSLNENVLTVYNIKATQELIYRVEKLEEENKLLKDELLKIKQFLKLD